MAPIVVSTEINRSAEDVFAYATDPERFSEWQTGVVDGKMSSAGESRVGDQCRTSRKIGGAVRPSTSILTHVDAPKTWGVRGIDGPIRATVDVAVKPIDDVRTYLTISVDFEGHGIGRILVPLLVRREAAKEMPANIAALKKRLEGAR